MKLKGFSLGDRYLIIRTPIIWKELVCRMEVVGLEPLIDAVG
jgi:hypothetical protein